MNKLVQLESRIIGSQEDAAILESKKSATLLIISDTHGDYDVLCDIIEEFGPQSDALVFCGDGICDIGMYIQESYEDEKLRDLLPNIIALTKGNGDSERYPIIYSDPDSSEKTRHVLTIPNRVEFTAAGRNIIAVHGHKHSVESGIDILSATASTLDADLVFYGHTHRPYWEENSGTLILNPGSCSRPRGSNIPSFAVVSFPGVTERYDVSFFGVKNELFGHFSFYPIRP